VNGIERPPTIADVSPTDSPGNPRSDPADDEGPADSKLVSTIAAYLHACLYEAFGARPGAKGKKAIEQATLKALENFHKRPNTRQRAAGFNKQSYMRNFIASKRERLRRAVDIENRRRGQEGLPPLRGDLREQFMNEQARRWKSDLDQWIEDHRREDPNRYLPFAFQQEIREQFWEGVDRDLSAREISLRK
jgi:hypothetical protein